MEGQGFNKLDVHYLGHCCCLCCSSDEDDIEDMQAEASSLERQRKKARLAGYDDY